MLILVSAMAGSMTMLLDSILDTDVETPAWLIPTLVLACGLAGIYMISQTPHVIHLFILSIAVMLACDVIMSKTDKEKKLTIDNPIYALVLASTLCAWIALSVLHPEVNAFWKASVPWSAALTLLIFAFAVYDIMCCNEEYSAQKLQTRQLAASIIFLVIVSLYFVKHGGSNEVVDSYAVFLSYILGYLVTWIYVKSLACLL